MAHAVNAWVSLHVCLERPNVCVVQDETNHFFHCAVASCKIAGNITSDAARVISEAIRTRVRPVRQVRCESARSGKDVLVGFAIVRSVFQNGRKRNNLPKVHLQALERSASDTTAAFTSGSLSRAIYFRLVSLTTKTCRAAIKKRACLQTFGPFRPVPVWLCAIVVALVS